MFSSQIDGADALVKKLLSGGPIGEEELGKALNAGAMEIKKRAVMSIQRGSRSGKIYRQNKAGATHQASAPGEPPKSWTGALVRNITTNKVRLLEYNVGSRDRAPYGAYLELGTSRMDARPWLGPAFEDSKPFIQERLALALKTAIRRVLYGR